MIGMLDCIIVGQGIAGTCLGVSLEKAGLNIMFIQDKKKPCASKISAGLIQPISGKFLSSNKLINLHFNKIIEFYKNLEIMLDSTFFNSTTTYLYLTALQKKIAKKKSKNTLFSKRFNEISTDTLYTKQQQNAYRQTDCFLVDSNKLLSQTENYFFKKGKIFYDTFDEAYLKIQKDFVGYKQYQSKYLIFCTGSDILNISLFKSLSFKSVKGEVLVLNKPNHNINYVVQNEKWCAPVSNNEFKFGSTYVYDNLISPTKSSWKSLVKSINTFGFNEDNITSMQSGIRVFTEDYLPKIGVLKTHPRLGLFSGFSSKGFSYAPIMAQLWAPHFPNIPEDLLNYNINN
jgi:hypothetical protein